MMPAPMIEFAMFINADRSPDFGRDRSLSAHSCTSSASPHGLEARVTEGASISLRRGTIACGRASRRPERGESWYGGGASPLSTSVSADGGKSNRTRLGVRGIRGSASEELAWPGWTTRSSSSEELPERRPRSSSLIGSMVLSPSLRTVCGLALAMLLPWKHCERL